MHRYKWLLVTALVAGVTGDMGLQAGDLDEKTLARSDIEVLMDSLSNWGRWGKDDQLGTLNLITPAKRKQAAKLVQEGISISIAHESVKEEVDQSAPFEHTVTVNSQLGPIGSAGDVYSVAYHDFIQTHLNGLAHLFYRNKLYNGFSSKHITPEGCPQLGIENFRNGIFTKAVLMDIPQLLGVKYLAAGQLIYRKHLDAWEKIAGVKVESGDAVLINTGRWIRRKLEGPWTIFDGSAGLHASCLPWLKSRDVAVIGSDLCLDVVPSGVEGFDLPVHWVVVTAMGTPILDNCDFTEASKFFREKKRWSFLLTADPLVVPGGTGSPINPVATF